jgi:hypothetical protein
MSKEAIRASFRFRVFPVSLLGAVEFKPRAAFVPGILRSHGYCFGLPLDSFGEIADFCIYIGKDIHQGWVLARQFASLLRILDGLPAISNAIVGSGR